MTDHFLEMMDNLQRQMDFLRTCYVESQQDPQLVELQVGELLKHPESLKTTLGEILHKNGVLSDADFEKFKADIAKMPEVQEGAAKYGPSNWEIPTGTSKPHTDWPKTSTDWDKEFLKNINLGAPPTNSEKEMTEKAVQDLREFFRMFHNSIQQVDQIAAVLQNNPNPRERSLITLFACLVVRCNQSPYLSKLYAG